MSTRSYIVDRVNNRAIYCHWDGYPSHNGTILRDNYTNQKLVDKLIDLGDLSCLGMILESVAEHKESQKAIVGLSLHTKAYHRDCEEPWDKVKPRDFDVFMLRELKKEVDYIYQWNGEYWTVIDCSRYVNSKSDGSKL